MDRGQDKNIVLWFDVMVHRRSRAGACGELGYIRFHASTTNWLAGFDQICYHGWSWRIVPICNRIWSNLVPILNTIVLSGSMLSAATHDRRHNKQRGKRSDGDEGDANILDEVQKRHEIRVLFKIVLNIVYLPLKMHFGTTNASRKLPVQNLIKYASIAFHIPAASICPGFF